MGIDDPAIFTSDQQGYWDYYYSTQEEFNWALEQGAEEEEKFEWGPFGQPPASVQLDIYNASEEADKNKIYDDWVEEKREDAKLFGHDVSGELDRSNANNIEFTDKDGNVSNNNIVNLIPGVDAGIAAAYSFIPTRTNTRMLASILKDKERQLDYFM